MPTSVVLDGSPLRIEQVERVARHGARVRIAPRARAAMAASRREVERCLRDGRPHYGMNTGFGSLSRERIEAGQLRDLQRNLVRSHAAGVGPPLPGDTVRGMMLLLAASLARGCSGVRPIVAERLAELLNAGITPVVPETGSVGASGDLAPLAHAALVLIGEGEILGRARSGRPPPLTLEAKEGLALINGTHLMAAQGALVLADADRLLDAATAATAMAIDACRATDEFLDDRVYDARNQPGPASAAARLRALLAGSRIIPSHRDGDPRVQDPYSLRCAAVVLGAAMDAIEYVRRAVDAELGAVTDNPLVFSQKRRGGSGVVSAGNFHGMPIAIPLDVLSIALAHVAGIAERRVYYMLSAPEPEMQLRPFLTPRPGLQSGLMIVQYTAAACVNEMIGLANPASVANIPTCAGMEDYNSFGPRAAAKAERALRLAERVIAIELLCAAEGIDVHRPLKSGRGVEAAHAVVRRLVPRVTEDRSLTPAIEALAGAIRDGSLVREVRRADTTGVRSARTNGRKH